MNNARKPLRIFIVAVLFMLTGNFALAATPDFVSVFHADGTAFSSKPLVFETNILPGDVFLRRFYIVKKDKNDQVLMLRFRRKMTPRENALARRILVRLKRISDGKFLRFPNGQTGISLWRLYDYRDFRNSDAFPIDKLYGPAGSRFDYEFSFAFSPHAGNRFQKMMTKFDLSVGVFSKPTGTCRDCICFWKNFCCNSKDLLCRTCGKLVFGL